MNQHKTGTQTTHIKHLQILWDKTYIVAVYGDLLQCNLLLNQSQAVL